MNWPFKFQNLLLAWVLLLSGCATSDPSLWPPTTGTPTKEIYVSLDTWHAMIGFQQELRSDQSEFSPDHSVSKPSPAPVTFEEWGYAERAWYLEGKHGITGVFRALFWPSQGVVEIGEHDQLWADRTLQPPSDLFKFELNQGGYNRLRAHLQSTRESSRPIKTFTRSRFFKASDSYHIFHHCHQYVARALKRAGLPVSTFWAMTRTGLANQLQDLQDSLAEGEKNNN